ncbi:MAG: DnaA N-terminal domain-containing protein [Anaerolineales bacterium]
MRKDSMEGSRSQVIEVRTDIPVQITADHLRAYDAIVRPTSIIPVPRYFIDKWVPLLGPSRAWLTLAFRQIAFVSRSEGGEVVIQTTLRRLSIWCGLSHVRIHQLLQEPGLLDWFVRPSLSRSGGDKARSAPSDYRVRADIPLSPEDQNKLQNWLCDRIPEKDKDWIDLLEAAIEAKSIDVSDEALSLTHPGTIQDLVGQLRGGDRPLPPSIDKACTELHSRWVQPDRVVLVTHYFLRKWLPTLSPGLGWLITYLRSRVYTESQDDAVGRKWLVKGWGEAVSDLGISRKSITRWAKSLEAGLFFNRIEDVQDPIERRSILINVQLSEPIHPDDQIPYESLLDGQNLTSPFIVEGQDLTRDPRALGHDLTTTSQTLPGEGQKLTSLETELHKISPKLNTLSPLNSLDTKHYKDIEEQRSHDFEKGGSTVVVASWDISEILRNAGIPSKSSESVSKASTEQQLNFLGWLIFGLMTSTIEYPAVFAHSRFRRPDAPPLGCVQLAQTPFGQLVRWIRGDDYDVPQHYHHAITQLRRNDALVQLKALGVMKDDQIEDDTGALPELDTRDNGGEGWGDGEEAHHWNAAKDALMMTCSRNVFETWVKDIEFVSCEENTFVLGVANDYARDWLDNRLKSTAIHTLTGIVGDAVDVQFVVLSGDAAGR